MSAHVLAAISKICVQKESCWCCNVDVRATASHTPSVRNSQEAAKQHLQELEPRDGTVHIPGRLRRAVARLLDCWCQESTTKNQARRKMSPHFEPVGSAWPRVPSRVGNIVLMDHKGTNMSVKSAM